MADSLILMVLALVVFGPRRLPEIGRQIGKLMYEFRKASNDFKFQMEEELRAAEEADRRKKEEERVKALAAAAPAPALAAEASVEAQVSEGAVEAESTSQVPEAGPGAPIESPYPNEAIYPAMIAPTPSAPVEESYPRIQPPSTGEQVMANHPWRLTEEIAKISATQASVGASVEASPAVNGAAIPESVPVIGETSPEMGGASGDPPAAAGTDEKTHAEEPANQHG
jgi:sec-independent protein translocase protein TatB